MVTRDTQGHTASEATVVLFTSYSAKREQRDNEDACANVCSLSVSDIPSQRQLSIGVDEVTMDSVTVVSVDIEPEYPARKRANFGQPE